MNENSFDHRAEEWKPVVGWEQWYEASNQGRLRRIRWGNRENIVKSPSANSHGYLYTMLSRPGRRQCVAVHTVVAEAFLGQRPDGMEINHVDGIKTNNCIENLEYVTSSRNKRHALENGLRQLKLDLDTVRAIRAERGLNQEMIAEKYGIEQSTVSRILNGHRWNWIDPVPVSLSA